MNPTISWILTIVGPFALVLVPQWLSRRALAKRGLPEALGPARAKLLEYLHGTRLKLSHRAHGERLVPLREVVGDTVPESTRNQNLSRLKALHMYHDGDLMLPLVYDMRPTIIIALIFGIANVIASPGMGQMVAGPELGAARATGMLLVTVVCLLACVGVALAHLRIVDVLARLDPPPPSGATGRK